MSKLQSKKGAPPPNMAIHGVGAGIGLLILGVGYLLGVAPALQAKQRLGSDRETINAMRVELDSAEDQVRRLRQAEETARLEVAQHEIRLRGQGDRNEVIAELASFAERENLRLNQIRAGRIEPGKPISVVPIVMSGTCSFSDFDRTLALLRDEFPDVRIRSFSIGRTVVRPEQSPSFEFHLAWCIESGG